MKFLIQCHQILIKRGTNNTLFLVNKAFQRRWFVLKGNLLFYYEKRGHPEPLGEKDKKY